MDLKEYHGKVFPIEHRGGSRGSQISHATNVKKGI